MNPSKVQIALKKKLTGINQSNSFQPTRPSVDTPTGLYVPLKYNTIRFTDPPGYIIANMFTNNCLLFMWANRVIGNATASPVAEIIVVAGEGGHGLLLVSGACCSTVNYNAMSRESKWAFFQGVSDGGHLVP